MSNAITFAIRIIINGAIVKNINRANMIRYLEGEIT